MKVAAITINKGGVGKTMISRNLGTAAAADGKLEVSYFALWHIVRRAGLGLTRPSTRASKIGPTSRDVASGGAVGCNG